MKKIKRLFTIGFTALFMVCMSISLVGCKKEKVFLGSEDYSNPTALSQSYKEIDFDGDIIVSQYNKYFQFYFDSAYSYSILFDGHPFTYKIYNLSNITTPIVDSIAGAIVPFPLASNSYLLEIEGYVNMAKLKVNMTIKRWPPETALVK